MNTLNVTINNIKNIKEAVLEIPLEKGIYAFVGSNGCGKSTIMQVIAQLINPKKGLYSMKISDYISSSKVVFSTLTQSEEWYVKENQWKCSIFPRQFDINGMYEGSLFIGTRFGDSSKVDMMLQDKTLKVDDIVDSDEYIKDELSFILHGNYNMYRSLKRIRNREIAKNAGFDNLPYFLEIDSGAFISQYRMSSGECLLISLLHFIYNSIIRRSLPLDKPILVLIDEIELALHPIAVARFINLLQKIVDESPNVIAILTSHSPEVIRRIDPLNMYKLAYNNGKVKYTNPCYPSYAIRDVYQHEGYDYLILTEDKMTRFVVNKILNKSKGLTSKLVHIIPVGGWENVLQLQKELISNNVIGIGRKIISVLDGDIESQVKKEYSSLEKLFLPIPSIEKFLFDVLYKVKDDNLKKLINDKYFPVKSVDMLISDFNKDYKTLPKSANKKFYFMLKKDLENRGVSEDDFITNLCEDIISHTNFSKFSAQLSAKIQ